ncbi:very short patch repair endonuclease [Sporobacter termitidis]|uniref:very short patch repair endonuclease n=1 Tax=Sporobacter termitidis TaxID=44749 RepID=UPI000933605E|nr:very short patch repair endonuclease [Sporobacter termitidis]
MSDVLTPAQRHKCMSKIKGRDTKPELIVRSWLHQNGYRFRVQKADLPGKPDIVLRKFKLVIFVNGCYWHRHPECKYAATPSTNVEFWEKKFSDNRKRDMQNINNLQKLGWNVLVIWECQVRDETFMQLLVDCFSQYKN